MLVVGMIVLAVSDCSNKRVKNKDSQCVVLIGSDIPAVTMDRMVAALTRLMMDELVIGAQQQDLSYLF